jgi:hypothetical protein
MTDKGSFFVLLGRSRLSDLPSLFFDLEAVNFDSRAPSSPNL